MTERARIITNGESQTIELPETCRFPEGEREVFIHRVGDKVILEPLNAATAGIDVEQALKNGWSPEFLAVLGSLKDEEIPLPRQRPITETKDPFE
jgi:virulence-associated protein VagC